MEQRKLKFTIGDSVVIFRIEDFDDLDVDKLLKIDYSNLIAEMITFPVVVNRLGILCADMDNLFQEAKLDLSIYEAKAKDKFRDSLITYDEKGKSKRPTVDEVESALLQDKIWKIKKQRLNKILKEKEYMYSVYTSAKDKSEKLNKLSLTIKSGDVNEQIIQSQLNNVYFKMKRGLIKDEE
jgi:hypothetical protein